MKLNRESIRRAAEKARKAKGAETSDLVLEGLFTEQLAFVQDTHRKVSALTTRQAGKTHGVARKLLKTARDRDNSVSIYIGRTQIAARRVFWRRLKDEARKCAIECVANEAEKYLTLKNGSVIYVLGAETESDIDPFRGMVCVLIVVDEAQAFPPFMIKLISEVLEPTLNTTRGQLVMTGTPNSTCQGYFFDVTTAAETVWSRHRWTGNKNPAAHQSEEDLEQIKLDNAWTEESPAFRREWRGEWVPSDEELVYEYSAARNSFDGSLPSGIGTYVLGLDIGYRDRTTLCLCAYGPRDPGLYILAVKGFRGLTVDGIAEQIRWFKSLYKINTIVADTGGLGKLIVESLRSRYKLNITPAVKTEKLAAQRLMNTDFRKGVIKAVHGTPLTDEWSRLTIGPDGTENKNQPNDYCDAALYAYRWCRQYLYQPPVAPITEDYGDARMRKLTDQAARAKKQEKRLMGYLFPGGTK